MNFCLWIESKTMLCRDCDNSNTHPLVNRRELFSRLGTGMTGIALASLLLDDDVRAELDAGGTAQPGPQFLPKARSVIQLFQHGGPSHMDTLDPKPELNQRDGQPMPKYFTDSVAITQHGGLLGTPHKFAPAGSCGVEYS